MFSVIETIVLVGVGCVASLTILSIALALRRPLSIIASIISFLYFISYPLMGERSLPLMIIALALYLSDILLRAVARMEVRAR